VNKVPHFTLVLRGPIASAPAGASMPPWVLWLDDDGPYTFYRPAVSGDIGARINGWMPVGGQGDPFGWGMWPTIDPATATDTISSGPNVCFYQRIMGGGGWATGLTIQVVVSAGNVAMATYKPASYSHTANPSIQTAATGVIACPAAGAASMAYVDPILPVGAFAAISADSGTASFRGRSGPLSAAASGRGFYQTSAHPPPVTPAPTGPSASVVLLVLAPN
jgi:hypothetical protein